MGRLDSAWILIIVVLSLYDVCSNNILQARATLIEPDGPMALQYGRFSVREHNKRANDSLKFRSVVEGSSTAENGKMIVKLIIKATRRWDEHTYNATIRENPFKYKTKVLISFVEL